MKLKTLVLGAVASAAMLAGMAGSASAYIACNHDGDCWHTEGHYAAPGVRYDYHPDDWYFHHHWDGDRNHYRDYHEGRGYYRSGVWIGL